MSKRVAILTGGGDVPGLNMCLKSLVYRLIDLGFEPIGVRKGWRGLIEYNTQDPSTYSEQFIELTKNMVRPIDRTPGSFLHSSRMDPRCVPADEVPEYLPRTEDPDVDLTAHIQEVIKRLDYRALIVIGDDDTLDYAAHLSQGGSPVIGIPKTIHNNILGTDYTLGFSTGLARGVAFIHELRALAGSREQIAVIETFAAKSGYSSLLMGFLGGVDRVLIPEVPYDPERLALMVMQDKRQTPANYAMILVSDGAQPDEEKASKYGDLLSPWSSGTKSIGRSKGSSGANHHEAVLGSGLQTAQLLKHILKEEIVMQHLTYLLRTGSPDGQDLLGAANFAFIAAKLAMEGVYGRMAAFNQENMWTDVDLANAGKGVKTVDIQAWYDAENYQPKLSLMWSAES